MELQHRPFDLSGPPLDPLGPPFDDLLRRRILFLRGPLREDNARELVASLLALEADSDDGVLLYIDSPPSVSEPVPPDPGRPGFPGPGQPVEDPGSAVDAMFAVHDVITAMAAPVHTRCAGIAAEGAAFLLATGTGTRAATRHARLLLRDPGGRAEGGADTLLDHARSLGALRERMVRILSERSGQPPERLDAELARGVWLSAAEALERGLIDEIVAPRTA